MAPVHQPAAHTALTARLGRVLGICFAICFVTGLLSHYQYQAWSWLPEPANPVWLYRVTQGLHVTTGVATIPLLLVKLWSVYPRLFAWPPVRSLVEVVERLSVFVLVSSALVELLTGFFSTRRCSCPVTDADQTLFVYSTEPDSSSREAMNLLASWTLSSRTQV